MKRRILCLLTTLVMILSLCACGKNAKDGSSLTKITLNEVAHSIFYAPQYVAIENGYFADEGIDLNLVTGFGADKVMTSLIANEAQIGFMGSEASVYVYLEGSKDYAVNFAQLTQRAGNFLVSREPVENFSWEDIKGKTVLAGREGGMPQMVFEYILKNNGIDPQNDLNMIQNIDFGLTAGAFTGGQGDMTIEFEPHATSLELQKEGTVVASLGVESGYVPYTAYCAKQSYLEANPEIIQAFTNAIQKGLEYVNNHSADEIAKVIAPQFPETDVETIAIIIERYQSQGTWKNDTIFTEDSFNLLCDILQSAGQLNGNVPYEDIITTQYSENAIK